MKSLATREDELGVLQSGAEQLGLHLSTDQQALILAYLDLLERWTGVYNLTAVRSRPEMLVTHVLDCLAVVQPVLAQLDKQGKFHASVLDVGSGAGLPGVILSICLPQLSVVCIDTVAKKAAFIQQVALQLKLSNLKAIHGRVEKHDQQYDIVCSRAFASLADFVSWTRRCLRLDDGVWMAMKGKNPEAELAVLSDIELLSIHTLHVPGLDAERCLLWMTPKDTAR